MAAWTLTLAILLSACSLVDHSSEAVTPEYLTQHWVHSFEEEGREILFFRPKDFKEFAPSRFRMEYIFERGGACDWMYLAPNDAHGFKSGNWWVDPQDATILHVEQGDRTITYRIVELSKNLLRMELVEDERTEIP